MSGPTERAAPAQPPAGGLGPLRRLLLALVLTLFAAGGLAAQEQKSTTPPEWQAAIKEAGQLAADPETETEALEASRDQLQRMRSAAIEREREAAGRVADVQARLDALGPPPAEGATEPPEIAQRRAQIAEELSEAQVPLLEVQDFQRSADTTIRDIDRLVRGRFAAELRSRGPSPVFPPHWIDTTEAVGHNMREIGARYAAQARDDRNRAELLQRLPLDLLLALVGIAISFGARRRLIAWVEDALSRASSKRMIALLVNLRNFARLIVPAVGAGLLFGALDPQTLFDGSRDSGFFVLPGFLTALIAASWLAASLFAPQLAAYRLLPVDDAEAARGARLTLALGGLVSIKIFLQQYLASWELTPAEAATIAFPIFLLASFLLWRAARLLRGVRRDLAERDRNAPPAERTGSLTLALVHLLERAIWLIAVATPLLAAVGYQAAATFFSFGATLSLALFGTCVVLYDLAVTTLGAVEERKGAERRQSTRDSLLPVLVGAILTVLAVPIFVMIWGARSADIMSVYYQLRDGVTFGGIRISIGMVVTAAIVFSLLYGLSRLLQSVLRNSVLPRTKLDAGGKSAVLAGVGYVGFFIAAIAAVSSTGINLTSLAFVAGGLSLGIGFGLQNIVSNFVSGIILLVERPIKEGDWIEVGGFQGYVRGISVRSTEIETFDRASVILPNSDLVAGTVLNRTHSGLSGRLQVPVTVALDSDPRHVERILLEIAEGYPLVLTEPSPRVLLMEIGPDALVFEIRCWLRDVNFSLSAKSDIHFEILERFVKEDIHLQPFLRIAPEPETPPAPPPTVHDAFDAREAEDVATLKKKS